MALSLAEQVPDGTTVRMDTSPIVYLLEGNPLAAIFRSLFAAIDAGRIRALVKLAVALQSGCHALATDDRDFGKVTEVLILGAPRRRASRQ